MTRRGRTVSRMGYQQNATPNGFEDDKRNNEGENGFDSIKRVSVQSNQRICDTQYDTAAAQFYSTGTHQPGPSSEDLQDHASRMEILSADNSQPQSSIRRNSTVSCNYLIIDPNVVGGQDNYAVISAMEQQMGGRANRQSADVGINDSGQIVLLDSSTSRLLQVDDDADDSQRFIQSQQQQHQHLPAGCWSSQKGEEMHFPIIQLEPIGHSVSCLNSSNSTGNNTDSTLMNRSLTSSNSSGQIEMNSNSNSIGRVTYTTTMRPANDINGMFCSSPVQFNTSGALNCTELNSQGELTVTDESSSFINEDGLPRGMPKDIDIDLDRLCSCHWTNNTMGLNQWIDSLGCRQHGQQGQMQPPQQTVGKANCHRCSNGTGSAQNAMLYSSTTSLSMSHSPIEQTHTGTLRRITKDNNNQSKRPERVRFVGCDN